MVSSTSASSILLSGCLGGPKNLFTHMRVVSSPPSVPCHLLFPLERPNHITCSSGALGELQVSTGGEGWMKGEENLVVRETEKKADTHR